ncbi:MULTISPECIES: hypothetical protein [unclassified Streptomyces]|uniref:hypothetical protein n=1 Tax=unclassified Streptomyces TaxID=2593676 RepID=UPI002DDA5CE6|nr:MULTISPECIES: hypothetical protein [unclassified Streptomyces]WSB74657.1 hypothetical protein OHB04_01950 [Streptomyces sp. NBC_01775]WSS16960.1 hypothetical protein OG533_37460 [Streptomyces sp. NBC_01186]WSS45703.1 hypothetical protein OG220_37705 [Streptomyces sp. NBC_01187]
MSYPQTAPPQGGTHPGVPGTRRAAAPPRRPGLVVAMLVTAVLAALSGAIGSMLVFVGGKDLADENVRKAVDNDPSAVGLPSGTTAADIEKLSGTMWDDVVTEWQGTMSARATIALVFAVALLLFALLARNGAVWARVMITIVALLAAAFPHALILRDAAPSGLYMTSIAAILLGLLALVMCWLPPVGRYKKALRNS